MSELSRRNRANKKRGYRWESDTCRYFNEVGFSFKRNGQRHGWTDEGDIDTGDVPLAVQCKDAARISIWQVAEDAAQQAANKGVTAWVILLKRRRRSTGDGLAILPMWLYRAMAAKFYGHTA